MLDLWAIDPEGQFYRSIASAPSVLLWHQIDDRSDVLLGDALQCCRELTKEEVLIQKWAECRKAGNPEKIRRMLYVFLRDLLASPVAGMILEKKSLRDRFFCDGTSFPAYNFHLTGRPLGPFAKLMVLVVLCGLLMIMLGYVLTFAALHPSQLQRAWLYGLYTWAIVDALLISSCEVLVQQVLIPSIIKADLHTVMEVVNQLIPAYTEKVWQDHLFRTALTDPVQVHNGHAVGIPDDQLQSQTQPPSHHNITDLFFVTARIAEHDHDTALARFLHHYSTMEPPGTIFPKQRWYRRLEPALERATRKFKNPTLFTRTLGHGYPSMFKWNLAFRILQGILVAYIYAPIWLQDVVLQFALVLGFGILLIVAHALYKVQGYLIAIPLVLVVVAVLVYRFFAALRRGCLYLWGASNRVRPSGHLPTAYGSVEDSGKQPSVKGGVISVKANRVDRVVAEDLESSQPSPILGQLFSSKPSGPTETVPLGSRVDGALSPDRPSKHLPERGSPHYSKSGSRQFFASAESEVEGDAVLLPRDDSTPGFESVSSKADKSVVGGECAVPPPPPGPPAEEQQDSGPVAADRQQGPTSPYCDDQGDEHSELTEAGTGCQPPAPSAVPDSTQPSATVGPLTVGDDWESSHSDDDLFDLPREIVRSMSSRPPLSAAVAGGRASLSPSADDGSFTAGPVDSPPLRVQTLFSPNGSALSVQGQLPSPAPSQSSVSVLPLSQVARSVASEEDDSDYEEYGPDDVSRESFDEPTEHLRLY